MTNFPRNIGYSEIGSSITNALLYQLSYPGIVTSQALSSLLRRAKKVSVAVFVPLFDPVPYKIRHTSIVAVRLGYQGLN